MKETPIQWCDSSLNLMMGCNGCELWNPDKGVLNCYAGAQTVRRAGLKGWPEAFDRPRLFLDRRGEAMRWRDLRGHGRQLKPWLDGYPRTIFLNDMGDTFTENLPVDWLTPVVQLMNDSPHVWIVLTKRPQRMLQWVRRYQQREPLPKNVWLCTSVTGAGTLGRLHFVEALRRELPAHVIGVSAEPVLDDLAPRIRQHYPHLANLLSWVIVGGESSQFNAPARPAAVEWLRSLCGFFRSGTTAVFLKQLGSAPTENGKPLRLRDGHGGDWAEWPEDLRWREMPRPRPGEGGGND